MTIRFAGREDLPAVNLLRRQVKELHAAGRPDVFKPGFGPELELNMWEFNQGALAFYEAEGFETYRRYMEAKL